MIGKKNKIYHCSYLRLNQGVLLPDGNVNLCCNDYSVGAIIGSLNNTKLDKIYNQEKILSEDFIYGKNSVCKKCSIINLFEFFKPGYKVLYTFFNLHFRFITCKFY